MLVYCILMTDGGLTCITIALDTCYLSGFLYFTVGYATSSRILFIDLYTDDSHRNARYGMQL